jgi:hypothetical protein
LKKILFLLPILLFAFEVEFTKIYKEYVVPNQPAILIQTHDNSLTFPFKYFKVPNGYILVGDLDQINMWLDNNFYAPSDAKFKNIKIAIVDTDKIQYKIISKIKNTYKKCQIKQIIFLSPDETKIITKPETIKEKYKIILDCK